MTADDDDDGLKSLRAVWLSMPDEDPPERGLADLMAAARVKADEMTASIKPPASLWQRFMESLRRPPVLAFATVMVLIGGAVLVGNRSKDMDAQPTVTAPEAQTGNATAVTESAARDEGRAFSAGSAAAAAVPSEPPASVVVGTPEQPRAEEPKAEAPPMKRPPRGGKDTAPTEKSAPTKSVTVESKKSAEKLDHRRDDDTLLLDSDGEADELKQEATTRPSGGTSTSGADSPKAQAPSDSAALSSAPSVAQLHQSARAAAARGDCEAVRTISRTIAKRDPAYYKAKVVPDASVSRCVIAQ